MRAALSDGSAYRAFQTMIKMQGVSPALADRLGDWLPRAAFTTLLYCPTAGPVAYSFCVNRKKFINTTVLLSHLR